MADPILTKLLDHAGEIRAALRLNRPLMSEPKAALLAYLEAAGGVRARRQAFAAVARQVKAGEVTREQGQALMAEIRKAGKARGDD